MPTLLTYLIKLTIGLSVMSLFYQLILSRLTFYTWNRWYLLIYSVLAFLIPLINITPSLPSGHGNESRLVEIIPVVGDFVPATTPALEPAHNAAVTDQSASGNTVSWDQILVLLFFAGAAFMTARLVLSWLSYLRLIRDAVPVSEEEGVKIYHIYREVAPFSFGNGIFFNPDLHSKDDLAGIVLHELVHVRQRHSVDILWAEILCIINWFNPLVWMARHAIRQNHEYIADREVLNCGINAKQYQYLLLKVVGVPNLLLVSQFSISSLKNRIIMMNKHKTAGIYLIRFFYVLPVLVGLMVIFRDRINLVSEDRNKAEEFVYPDETMTRPVYMTGIVIDGETGLPVQGLSLKLNLNDGFARDVTTDANGFYCEKIAPHDSIRTMGIHYQEGLYKRFDQTVGTGGSNFEFGQIVFVVKNVPTELRTGVFWEDMNEAEHVPVEHSKEATLEYLQQKAKVYAEEFNLISAFRTRYHWTNQEITKFENGYFNRDRALIGYVGELEFYLDGKAVTYQQINDTFEYYPVEGLNRDPKPGASMAPWLLSTRMRFYSFSTNKPAPPKQYISPENMVYQRVEDFDLSRLENEAFMLDGFRQVQGMGSNLRPLRDEIKAIYLFRGNLAKYYDRKLDKIWWIETRPVAEVYGRPDLAMK